MSRLEDLDQYIKEAMASWHCPGVAADFDVWVKIQFNINDNGEIDAISIPIEPTVDNVIFKRKQLELPEEIIAALIGEYNPPVEGITFTITAQEDKIYFTQTGGTPQEIKPFKLTDDLVAFKQDRSRLEFIRQNNTIIRLVVKSPFMTLEAPRKG